MCVCVDGDGGGGVDRVFVSPSLLDGQLFQRINIFWNVVL